MVKKPSQSKSSVQASSATPVIFPSSTAPQGPLLRFARPEARYTSRTLPALLALLAEICLLIYHLSATRSFVYSLPSNFLFDLSSRDPDLTPSAHLTPCKEVCCAFAPPHKYNPWAGPLALFNEFANRPDARYLRAAH